MRRLLLVPVLAVALAGCSSSPEAALRGDVEDVIAAANSNDPGAVRLATEDLLGTISQQIAQRDLTAERGAQLRQLALAVQQNAGVLDPSPSPSPLPSPSQVPSEEPSPEPSPTPEETEEPSPSPEEPSPSPSETEDEEEDAPSPSPIVDLGPSSPSPAAAASPAAQTSSEPSPSALS